MTSPATAAAAIAARPAPRELSRLGRFLALDLLDDRYPALHGMRVLAIVSVVQYHVTAILAVEQHMPLGRGFVTESLSVFFGMDLFFVLSGFLIGSILIRSLDVTGSQKIRRFYLRRAFRTFPAYYVVLTYLALTTPLNANHRAHLPYEYLYLTNLFPTFRDHLVMLWGWSLALEEQFYLAVPLLFFLLYKLKDDRAKIGVLLAACAAALGVRLYVWIHGSPWSDMDLYQAIYFRTHTRFDTLIAGVILAIVHKRWGKAIEAWLLDPFHRALLALPALGLMWILLQPWMFGEKNMQLVRVFSWGTITSAMYMAWGLLLLHGQGFIQRALGAPFWRRVATLGYGVYLVHIPVCDHVALPLAKALHAREVPMAIVWSATLATLLVASLAVAYTLHVFVEKPAMWLRDRVAG